MFILQCECSRSLCVLYIVPFNSTPLPFQHKIFVIDYHSLLFRSTDRGQPLTPNPYHSCPSSVATYHPWGTVLILVACSGCHKCLEEEEDHHEDHESRETEDGYLDWFNPAIWVKICIRNPVFPSRKLTLRPFVLGLSRVPGNQGTRL